ncbi:peptidylprolyl isomerase [Horticoccus luteus]|uniref:peptidylprolyl isomerase n=1 Tax=Horticoccus luteus TaxID=2862869 RepID=A0A8F9TWM5_9BACT|nr:peptidylprolyl isomerase [Horticoccus luteus]QYM79490.1 peptidylprolyl isomerase [Horticoccus luteus]
MKLPTALGLFALCFAATLPAAEPPPDGLYADIATPRGVITAELFFQQAPLTVANFVGLAEGTLGPAPRKPFYDGLLFHRVVPGFVIQAGDPLGTGEGGPGYAFPDEFVPGLRHDAAGILSMANDGPDTNGSQFFITLAPVNRLNYLHSVFGRVVSGAYVLPRIQPRDKIYAVRIRRVGAAADAFRVTEASFAALVARAKPYPAEKTPGPSAPFDDPDHLLPTDPPRAQAFNYKLANFERATGHRVRARLFAKYTPDTPAQRPGNFIHKIAEQLHVERDGLLAVYFADIDKWALWIGDDLVTRFVGQPGTAQQFTKSGAFHEAKQAFIAQARAAADAAFAAQKKAASADSPVPPAQHLKLETDAMLDGLIFFFEKP